MIEPGTYLLYNAGCASCTSLAEQVIAASNGSLKMASLRAPEFNRVLRAVRPLWRFEPTLLTVDGRTAQVATGFLMRFRLLWLLGPRRAIRVARIASRFDVPVIGMGTLSTYPARIAEEQLRKVGSGTRVWVRLGRRWKINATPKTLVLRSRLKKIKLAPQVIEEIRYMASLDENQGFAASAIPGTLDESRRVRLVRVLLQAGFLTLTPPRPRIFATRLRGRYGTPAVRH